MQLLLKGNRLGRVDTLLKGNALVANTRMLLEAGKKKRERWLKRRKNKVR